MGRVIGDEYEIRHWLQILVRVDTGTSIILTNPLHTSIYYI